MSVIRNILRPIPGVQPFAKFMRERTVRRELRQFAAKAAMQRPDLPVRWDDRHFFVDDRTAHVPFDSHYIYHTAWAARQLERFRPVEHVDISSSLYLVAIASAFIPIRHFDYRQPDFKMDGVTCGAADLLALPFPDASLSSLSCMHVIEHIGLGRYGDPLDVNGDRKAAAELQRVLAPGGNFFFVTPVGRPRVCFNAHRVYSYEMVASLFPDLRLEESWLVEDDGSKGLLNGPSSEQINRQNYGCGCFRFVKASD